jgi:hypothetical protein
MRKPKGLLDDFKADLIERVRQATVDQQNELRSKSMTAIRTTPKPPKKTLAEIFKEIDSRRDLTFTEKLAMKHLARREASING